MADERYTIELNRAVNHVMDLTMELVPPDYPRQQILNLRVYLLDRIIQRLQAERAVLDKRRD